MSEPLGCKVSRSKLLPPCQSGQCKYAIVPFSLLNIPGIERPVPPGTASGRRFLLRPSSSEGILRRTNPQRRTKAETSLLFLFLFLSISTTVRSGGRSGKGPQRRQITPLKREVLWGPARCR
ncbi:hypothetical protein SKAU_G00184650 [Synaphobranchus kaupii]|uniref:Uncharacterized protein n=1 Tax=Synaphobranchus kaupii TaxID=118154 RepID=A0A9Q1FCI4_SYNKA|nr:hypothetical protein SKAU_G00184650 [Synaphobranchus kaupii]